MSVPDVALAGALLLIARSAARTVVVAMAVLLVRFGSKVVAELTVAVLESVLPSSAAGLTWTPRVKVAVAPLANEPMVQFTVPVEPAAGVVQLQPAGVGIDWNVVSAGSGSFIDTLAEAFGPALLTVIVYVSVPPGVSGSGASVLVIARLASARTVVVAMAVLLVRFGSKVVAELTVAVLESVLPSSAAGLTWTPRVKVAVAPLANEPMVQFTVPVEPAAGVVQLQPAGVGIDWNVVSAGSGSFIDTLAEAFGPALLTVIVYVSVPPGVTGSGESVLVIARLASARTVVVAMAVLLVRFGSKVVAELTVAVLESVLPSSAAGLTWTPRVKVAVAPLANEPMVQFTVPVEPAAGVVQLQPAGVGIDWNVVSAGSGSFIVTLAAAFGPALLTVIVYVSVPPGVTGSGESVLVIERLASARTVVVAMAVLLVRFGSKVVAELTVAEL